MPPNVQLGLERCLDDPPGVLRVARFGLLMNQASVDQQFTYACDRLAAKFPGLAALFSPQHGLWCEQQANMIESPHTRYLPLDLPVFSLYSETRRPTAEMLSGLDAFVVDLQDVGTRVYTFTWTMLECLRACAAAGLPVVILDRPNPLGGRVIEGPLLEPGFTSFVGGAAIPMRHGLTLGELALLLNDELQIGAALEIVPMLGWGRDMLWPETGRTWVAPSPNMPRWETALLYPGQVMLEGTNLSEGRGTTLPFEVVGAPLIEPNLLTREMSRQAHAGLALRPVRFVPTADKWFAAACGGIAVQVVDPPQVRSFRFTVDLLVTIARLFPTVFRWSSPPYEYECEKPPIDILYGSAKLREAIAGAEQNPPDIDALSLVDPRDWWERATKHLLYGD